jgi:putative DNA primase/helicase
MNNAAPLNNLLAKLDGVKPSGPGKYSAKCPAHDDNRASLSISQGDDGRVLLHDHAGCTVAAILAAVGLTMSDLFMPKADGMRPRAIPRNPKLTKAPPNKSRRSYATLREAIDTFARFTGGRFVKDWPYFGPYQFHIVRYDLSERDSETGKPKKEFRPFHYSGTGFVCADPPGKLPLYNICKLPADGPVWVFEGEKCADTGTSIGLFAVTSAHGAEAARKSDWAPLAGREVFICPDSDEVGHAYAREVATILTSMNCTVRIIDLFEGDHA